MTSFVRRIVTEIHMLDTARKKGQNVGDGIDYLRTIAFVEPIAEDALYLLLCHSGILNPNPDNAAWTEDPEHF